MEQVSVHWNLICLCLQYSRDLWNRPSMIDIKQDTVHMSHLDCIAGITFSVAVIKIPRENKIIGKRFTLVYSSRLHSIIAGT